MLKTKIIWTLLLLPIVASAEFFVWYDEVGIKHVSTHPRECIDRSNRVIKHECRLGQEFDTNDDPSITDIYRRKIIKSGAIDVDSNNVMVNYFSDILLEDCNEHDNKYQQVKGDGPIAGMFTLALGLRAQNEKYACLKRNRQAVTQYLERQ